MTTKHYFYELEPGICLGDAHYINQGLAALLKNSIVEPIQVVSAISLHGGLHTALDTILKLKLVEVEKLKPEEYMSGTTNKLIYVLGRQNYDQLVVGWSYDNSWLGLSVIEVVPGYKNLRR